MRDDVITADNRFVEVVLRWGGVVTDVKRLKSPLRFTVGKQADDALFVPVDGDSWNLLTTAGPELFGEVSPPTPQALHVGDTPQSGVLCDAPLAVRFKRGMSGTVTRAGVSAPLSSSGAVFDGDAFALLLTDDTVVTIGVGRHALQVKTVAKSRAAPWSPAFDALWANAALISVFTTVALVAALFFWPASTHDLEEDLFKSPARLQRLVIKAAPNHDALVAALNVQENPVVVDTAPASGKSLAPTKRTGPVDSAKHEASAEDVVAGKLAELFGSDGVASVFLGPRGSALDTAIGQLKGVKVAGGNGVGSLGLRGGVGVGVDVGVGVGTLSGGTIHTNGRSAGDVDDGSVGGLGSKSDREIAETLGPVCIFGSIDAKSIRRVVRDHAGQVRYCYESGLARTPGLGGKVTMKWVIDGEGHVTQASTDETQMNDANVEACLASRIKGWSFPKPPGGGIVVVTYPFVFKQAG